MDILRLARSIAGSSLGLALSGGGARGFAHIGVLKVLAEAGLEIDSVGGTSMGSIIAGMFAMGYDVPKIIERSRSGIGEYAFVGDFTVPVVALMRGASTARLCKSLFGDVQIEDLWIPYFCVTTNLSRAEVVVHEEGPLWRWICASSSAPGISPPVPHQGDLLVDGGVLNNLPADVMRARCRGSVIAVDVSAPVELRTSADLTEPWRSGWRHLVRALNPFSKRDPFPNILQILMRTAILRSVNNQDVMREFADLYIHPPTDAMPLFGWAAIDEFIDVGYRHSYDVIRQWMATDPRQTRMRAAIHRTGTWDIR